MTKISVEIDKDDAEFLIWLLDQDALEITDSVYYDEDGDKETVEQIDRIIANIKEATNA